jgi:hypothetical protein
MAGYFGIGIYHNKSKRNIDHNSDYTNPFIIIVYLVQKLKHGNFVRTNICLRFW